jgi:hypothetical protein
MKQYKIDYALDGKPTRKSHVIMLVVRLSPSLPVGVARAHTKNCSAIFSLGN